MAQVIKIKRGGIENLIATTPTLAQGELLLATGSLNGLGSTFFVADAANSPELPYAKIESVVNGATLAASLDANFTGLLIHSASNNKLYRYDGSDFVELPIAAGSFVGILPVTNGGTGQDTLDDIVGDTKIIVTNGTETVIGGDVTLSLGGGVVSGSAQINGASITNNSVNFGGVTVALGSSDTSPAFNLADATGLPIVNGTTGTLTVARGGTGATSLTDHGVLVGAGTGTINALAVGSGGQLLIGQSGADPSFKTVSGVININNNGLTSFTSTANSLISGSFTSVSASIASDISTNTAAIGVNASNISATNTNVTNIINGNTEVTLTNNDTYQYDNLQGIPVGLISGAAQIDDLFNLDGVVSASALSTAGQGSVTLTTNGVAASAVGLGLETDDSPQFVGLTLTGDAAVNGGDITTSATTFNLVNSTATTVNFAGAATTLNIGASTGTATIKNATINLGEEAGDQVNIKGNLTVSGTTTTVNSETVTIADNIIQLNSDSDGITNGGLEVLTGAVTASLLYDVTNTWWETSDGTTARRVVSFADNAGSSDISFVYTDTNGYLAHIDVETPSDTAGTFLQWDGSAMVASHIIDGGTF